jgi:hypothetical protein
MGQTKARWVGSRLNIYNGPIELTTGSYVVDENIYLSTAGATLKNYGFQTINTSQVATLPAPEDGCRTEPTGNSRCNACSINFRYVTNWLSCKVSG